MAKKAKAAKNQGEAKPEAPANPIHPLSAVLRRLDCPLP